MKTFFKTFFACLLALGTFLFVAIISLLIIGSAGEKSISIQDQSILHLKMDGPVVDRASDNPFENLSFSGLGEGNIGLNSLLKNIEHAKNDEKIKGIFLETSMINAGMATIKEIRDAILDFRASGKFTIAYSEVYTQKDYYLASACEKVYIFPTGYLEFKGLSKNILFMKGLLEKVGIEPQIIRHGKFKSAVEPFILDKMSNENREQNMNYMSDLWMQMVQAISKERKIEENALLNLAEQLTIQEPKHALEHKMIDGIKYYDEVVNELKTLTAKEAKDKLSLVSNSKYAKSIEEKKEAKEKVAVIYAMGDIVSGKGESDQIGSETIRKAIEKARLNEEVKAIVLRVNSPGGSALASDVIWREMMLAKETKSVVVSMGDVAASGGYYISCAAHEIFANENTITGSIGVFGMLPNMKKLYEEKLGLTFDGVKTNQYADLGSLHRPLTDSERNIIQQSVEKIYDDFISKVSDGRSITKAEVDSIGQGRVWSGLDAKSLQLIDQYGGMKDAIKRASELARLEKYSIIEYPEKKSPVEAILASLSGEELETKILQKKLGNLYPVFSQVEKWMSMQGVQARMPYDLTIE